MSLKHGVVNPLAVANIRRVNFCPPHFAHIIFDNMTTEKIILDWIHENTVGRFYYGAAVAYTGKGARGAVKVGFEVHSECTYFSMLLNTFNVNDFDF